jgi:hypothetical protein
VNLLSRGTRGRKDGGSGAGRAPRRTSKPSAKPAKKPTSKLPTVRELNKRGLPADIKPVITEADIKPCITGKMVDQAIEQATQVLRDAAVKASTCVVEALDATRGVMVFDEKKGKKAKGVSPDHEMRLRAAKQLLDCVGISGVTKVEHSGELAVKGVVDVIVHDDGATT